MTPKKKTPTFRRVKIDYPPVPTRKWRPAKPRPHVADPLHRKPINRKPEYPHMHKVPHSTIPKSWHRYRMLSKRSAILFGDFAQGDLKYLLPTRGKQGPANCFMAIGFTKVQPMEIWDEYSINKILDSGNQLYILSVKMNKRTCSCTTPKEVYPSFFIGSLNIILGINNGIVEGNLYHVEPEVPILYEVLKRYFHDKEYAIIEIEAKFFALWKIKGSYYLFDPNDRDEDGDPCQSGLGFAVVVKFPDFSAMVQHIWDYCCSPNVNSRFTFTPIYIKKLDKTALIPPSEYKRSLIYVHKTGAKSCIGSKEPAKELAADMIRPRPVKSSPTVITGLKKPLPMRLQLKGKPKKKKEDPPISESNTPSLSSLVEPDRVLNKQYLIPKEKPRPPSVTYFNILHPSKYGILQASYHQCDPEFSRFGGKQELANAVAAIAMLRQHKSKLWFKKILDEILMAGETIFLDSRKNIVGDQSLGIHTITNKIKMNKLFYTPEIDEFTLIGKLNSVKPNVLDIQPALEEFFSNHDRGILRGPLVLAIWKEAEKYYMFDPNERDSSGQVITKAVKLGNYEEGGEDEEQEPGTACLMWFYSVADMATLYLSNVPKIRRRELFFISKTEINDYVEIAEDWNNFKYIRMAKWIIRGTISQNNPKYAGATRNTQCTAIATMAILYYKLTGLSSWNRELIDEILDEGDVFYQKNVAYLKKKKKFIDRMLMMNEVLDRYSLKEKELLIDIEECIVNGLLNAPDTDEVLNLKKGIIEFFKDCESGVVTARGLSVAFWKDGDAYYYFDSHGRDAQGYTACGGTACILRLSCLEDMSRIMRANLGAGNEDVYNIARVDVKLLERTPEGLVRPDFQSYTELSVQKGILRCSSFQGDKELYDVFADKQTIPNLMASLGMASIIPAGDWTRDDANEILLVGEALYEESRTEWVRKDMLDKFNWDKGEPRDLDDINVDNVIKEFYIGVNKVVIRIGKGKEGIFEADIPYPKNHKETDPKAMESTLRSMLYTALETETNDETKNETLIISPLISVAVWKDGAFYYLFDPRGKDQEGNFYGREFWSAKIVLGENEEEDFEDGFEYDDFDDAAIEETDNIVMKSTGEKDIRRRDSDEGSDLDDAFDSDKAAPFGLAAIDQTDAKACTILFTTLDEMTNHIIENVPPNKQSETFKMHDIKLTARPDTKIVLNPQDRPQGNWYEYQEIDKKRWILRGTINMQNQQFPEYNRGKQQGAMGVISCCFARLYSQTKFKPSTVDRILKYGDKLQTLVVKEYEKGLREGPLGLSEDEIKMILGEMNIRAPDVPKKFYLGEYLARINITPRIVDGDLTAVMKAAPIMIEQILPPPPPPPPPKGRAGKAAAAAVEIVEEPPPPPAERPLTPAAVMNLRTGLTVFFDNFNFGVLSAKHTSVGIWKLFDYYYMFDPGSRGPLGISEINGVACITRFHNLDQLAAVFEKNLTKNGCNLFTIDLIEVKSKVGDRPHAVVEKVIPAEPKITAFQVICPGKMILRGTFHQDNPRFKVRSGAASCPNALVALAMTHIHKASTWTKPIVDDILANGFILYKTTVQDLGYQFNTWDDRLLLDLVNSEFTVGVMKVNCGYVMEDMKRGILTIKDPDIMNVRLALQLFFDEHPQGVVESETLSTAVWCEDNLYYMFDPNARGSTGLYSSGGTACLLVFKNIKFLADHYISNIPRSGHLETFQITPVQMTVYEQKSPKPKPIRKTDILKVKELDSLAEPEPTEKPPKKHGTEKSCKTKVAKKLKSECCCPEKGKLVAQNALVMPEVIPPDQKKIMARAVRDAKRQKELAIAEEKMRNEYFTYDKGKMILRAHFSQNSEKYIKLHRNHQTYCNALVSIVMMKIHDLKTWTYKNIEIILDSGDQLYKDSYIKYRPTNPLLGLRNINREFHIQHYKFITEVYKPIMCGELIFGDLYLALLNFFTTYKAGIISCQELSVAVFHMSGEYYMFDPHERNAIGERCEPGQSGVACVLRFVALEDLIDKFLRNTGVDRDADELPKWSLLWVKIETERKSRN